ncbi:DUF4376 domain-containing protein [Pseudomonas sp. GG8]
MKYLTFDSHGVVQCRLIKGICDIPEGAIEVDDDLWFRVSQETDGVWMLDADGEITKHALPVVAPNYIEQIAAVRYMHETASITVGSVAIDTGRDSQALITGAALSAVIDPEYVCVWKTINGPVELTATQLIGVAAAVRAHVQACFDREGQLLAALAEGAFTVDMLDEGWPA